MLHRPVRTTRKPTLPKAIWVLAGTMSSCEFLRLIFPVLLNAADAVDRVVGDRDDVKGPIRPLFDVRGGAESASDLQRLAFGAVELIRPEKIVCDQVRQARIGADVHVKAVRREAHSIQAASVAAD